jgi:Uri superfamily endonuclease
MIRMVQRTPREWIEITRQLPAAGGRTFGSKAFGGAATGSYAIEIVLDRAAGIRVGKLGEHNFQAGNYVYCGSANGPGGLRARLSRHLLGAEKMHWHVDYLRQAGSVQSMVYQLNETSAHVIESENNGFMPLECAWSQRLSQLGGASIPVPGFGASDCRSGCRAHLIYLGTGPGKLVDLVQVFGAGAVIQQAA